MHLKLPRPGHIIGTPYRLVGGYLQPGTVKYSRTDRVLPSSITAGSLILAMLNLGVGLKEIHANSIYRFVTLESKEVC